MLWLDLFTMVNTLFCCVALFQSALCIMLEGHTEDHIFYMSLVVGAQRLWTTLKGLLAKHRKPTPTGEADKNKADSEESAVALLSKNKYVIESVAGILYRKQASLSAPSEPVSETHAVSDTERIAKLVYFESLFYDIDENGNQLIDLAEADGYEP